MKRIMNPESSVIQSVSNSASKVGDPAGKAWRRLAAALGLGLLVLLSVGLVVTEYLVPEPSSRSLGASSRAGWYLRSGQWRADVRTLAAAFEFVMDSTPEAPARTNAPAKQLAAQSQTSGSVTPTLTLMKTGSLRFTNS